MLDRDPSEADDAPIPYIERTRAYYLALGYYPPYRWAHFDEIPFAPLTKPLAQSQVALVTTAALYQPEAGEQGPGAPYTGASKFFSVYSAPTSGNPDVRIAHLAYDRSHTSASDPNTWFPLPQLRAATAAGRIGGPTARFHGVPTNRSQRVTSQIDAPELLQRCRDDAADVALLVPT